MPASDGESMSAAPAVASAVLSLNNVEVIYDHVALAIKGVSLEVPQGGMVALLGANGAGKSTTLKAIMGIVAPVRGAIIVNGENVTGQPAHTAARRGVALVPEGRRVFSRMTVRENLEVGGVTRPRSEAPTRMNEVFELFPRLKGRQPQLAGTLSGGEQQMLAIGRALMGKPRLLLLDEPSMGLAPMVVAQIFTIVREINESGVTVLLVEQNAAQALALADRGYVLETGELVLQGTGAELLADDRVRAAYLGEEIAAS